MVEGSESVVNDLCVSAVNVNESCFFHEQCEARVSQTECRDNRCICIFEKIPVTQPDGMIVCVGKKGKKRWSNRGKGGCANFFLMKFHSRPPTQREATRFRVNEIPA